MLCRDDVLGHDASNKIVDLCLERHAAQGVVGLFGAVGSMRRDDAAGVLDKGAIGSGLIGKDIESGSADAACAVAGDVFVQRGEQRLLVDNRATGGVNQEGARCLVPTGCLHPSSDK